MAENGTYTIRTMTRHEVDSIAIEWAAKEGWNPGLHDALSFWSVDPNGFFAGLLDDKLIACISAVAYTGDFGFLGFYIVKPEYRGRGYGLRIWNRATAYLRNQNIGLDGVLAQQPNYMKSGFRLAYRNIRYEGTAEQCAAGSEIVPISELPFDDLLQYDTGLFPAPRPRFLRQWIHQPESLALAATQDGKIAGYGVVRRCRTGHKIGPLFAETGELAEKLFSAALTFAEPGTPLYLDTPEINPAAVLLAERHGMRRVFETARMYTGPLPAIDMNKIFGVTTFELG